MVSKKGARKRVATRGDSLAQEDEFIREMSRPRRQLGDDDAQVVAKLVKDRRITSVRLRFTTAEVDIVSDEMSVCDCIGEGHLCDRLDLGARLRALVGDGETD